MSTYDPLKLASSLDLLVDELKLWTSAARETIHIAEQSQRQIAEHAHRISQKARLIADQAQRDGDLVEQIDADLAQLKGHVDDASERSRLFVDLGNTVLRIATGAQQYWESELAKARAWLKRAEARLKKAIEEYEKAVKYVRKCESEVRSAQSRLNSCRNDPERKNCSGPARDLAIAEQQLHEAIELLKLAQKEVEAAKQEVEEAKARVAGCELAVGFCGQAVTQATEAQVTTQEARAQSDQAEAHAEAARKLGKKAEESAKQEQAIADELMREVIALEHTIGETLIHLRNAMRNGENAQRYAIDGLREIDYRADQLRILASQRVI